MTGTVSTAQAPAGEPAEAQETAPVEPAQDATLPVDPDVTVGTLDNGLRYYIRRNTRPENRAELRLAVNAGSLQEDPDQLGLAHFTEHMAFNGTERFEKHELVDYLESIGTRFGPDLNAYTSFDETVYMLQVRTDSTEQLKTGFDVLREWASNVSLEDEEIDKERGVVIEEWRLGRGASARVSDKQLPVLLHGSRYAERLPIGTREILESFDYETVRRFYRDWYRPGLMAVVAIGDFDPDQIESYITERFSTLEPDADPRPRDSYGIPGHAETLVSVETDPELPYGSVQLVWKHEKEPEGTVEAYRQGFVERLYNGMFNDRLNELTQDTDPPFAFAFSGPGSFARSGEFYNLQAVVPGNGHLRAAEVLLTEAERVRRHGFTETELSRQKADLLRAYETAYAERDKTESRVYASEYIRNYLEDEPMPGIAFEYERAQQFLPTIGLDEVNRLATRYITDANRVILVDGPEREDVEMPAEEQLLALFGEVAAKDIDAYEESVSDAPLIADTPAPGTVVEESYDDVLDVTRFTLSNGVEVVLKPTDFKNDEILMSAYSPGGTSLVPDSIYVPASFASSLINQSGVGDFGPIELGKKLSGKVVGVSPSIGGRSEGFNGSASPQDLETLFQLVNLYVTAPRADSVAYASYKKRIGDFILSTKADPNTAFQDTISVTMSQYHPRAQPFSERTLEAMDLETSFDIYQDRFADLSDFTFYFVGNFDVDSLKALSATYLGSLPGLDREETWKDIGLESPEGRIEKIVHKGVEPKSQVRMLFTGPAEWSQDNRRTLNALTSAFQIKLREVLREDLGGTYGVGVGGSLSREPDEEFQITISFGCDPSRVEELIGTVQTQIDSLKAEGLPESYLTKVRETTLRSHETNLEQNRYWLGSLNFYDQYELDPRDMLDGIKTFMSGLTTEALHEAARKYFGTENVATFVLKPEATDATESSDTPGDGRAR